MTWYVNVYEVDGRQYCGGCHSTRETADASAGPKPNGRVFVLRVTLKGPTH